MAARKKSPAKQKTAPFAPVAKTPAVQEKATAKTPAVKTKAAAQAVAASKKALAKTRKPVPQTKVKPAPQPATAKKVAAQKVRGDAELDFSAFPPEALLHESRWICLACVLDVFTRQLGLAPVTAHSQIRRYTPSAGELTAHTPTRPYLGVEAEKQACRWCGAAPRWHVPLQVHRIESGKATDAARRDLVKALGTGENFQIVEEQSTQRTDIIKGPDGVEGFQKIDVGQLPICVKFFPHQPFGNSREVHRQGIDHDADSAEPEVKIGELI